MMKNIAILASGAGSNAQNIINYFKNKAAVNIALIICNKPGAGVLQIAEKEGIKFIVTDNETFKTTGLVAQLQEARIDFVILAGFLRKIPAVLIEAYPGRIINIHPALLPNYGGKGMYGAYVHEAVIAAGETKSGITIHYVDEHYDNGDIIFQASCPVLPGDTAQTLAQKIHLLEYEHFPRVIEEVVEKTIEDRR